MLASPGQPLIKVDMETVQELRMFGFTWTEFSNILNISRQTLYHCMDGSGLSWMGSTDVTDKELHGITR